jgi:hypothetical protein
MNQQPTAILTAASGGGLHSQPDKEDNHGYGLDNEDFDFRCIGLDNDIACPEEEMRVCGGSKVGLAGGNDVYA